MKKDLVFNDAQGKILEILFYYRCTTPIQLTQFIYKTRDISKSNEKYIYGQLAKLEDMKLVTRHKPLKRICKYSVFYLTRKGFELMTDEYAIDEGHVGKGWIDDDDIDFGYFDYSVYNPPLKQLQHHLMMIEILLDTYLAKVKHRNNLYASRFVKIPNAASGITLRPDAEMIINDEVYTIEIDRGTETHDQLYMKFKNYFEYQAEFNTVHERYDVHHIVFVVDANVDGHLNRRWTNMLAAYYKGLRGLAYKFQLHLVTKDEFFKFVQFEKFRENVKKNILRDATTRFNLEVVEHKERTDWNEYVVKLKDEKLAYLRTQVFVTPYSTRNVMSLVNTQGGNYIYRAVGHDVFLANPNKLKEYKVQAVYIKLYEDVHNHKAKRF